jgi:hypothetical protein
MRRGSAFHPAVRSAFSRAASEPIARGPGGTVATRISPYALAFVAGFPGAIGGLALAAAMSRAGLSDGAFALGVGLLLLAGCLLVLGLRSVLVVGPDRVTARFFGLRGTSVRFDRLTSATFGMTFPSISYGIALIDRVGRKAIVHANWWQDEAETSGRRDDVAIRRRYRGEPRVTREQQLARFAGIVKAPVEVRDAKEAASEPRARVDREGR